MSKFWLPFVGLETRFVLEDRKTFAVSHFETVQRKTMSQGGFMLFKRVCAIWLLLMTTALAADYLVQVDLDEQRLEPIFQSNLRPIAELDNIAILIVTDNELDRLAPYTFSIIDEDPKEGQYYLVRTVDKQLDLRNFGEIMVTDGSIHLLKINPGQLEELIKEKVDINRLMFTPIIRSGQRASSFYYNPLVQTIVDQVAPDSVLSFVQRLQDFVTRYSTHDSCEAAANYIAGKFTDYGCDSVYFQYHTGGHAPNVIGIKTGTLYPDSIYTVVCGHFDATSYLAPNIAPGADDNASGTASVIEALRVMRDYQFEYSVRYIAFSGEEFGLYGSYHYASLARSQGDSILGVLNADMIAYVNVYPESLDVLAKISNPPCEPFADFFIAAADSYTTLLTRKQMVTSASYSDHHPFWQNGYLALCNIEDNPPVNPYYHEPGDTIGAGYNDNSFCTEVVKAQVAALSLMARPLATAYLTMPDYWIVDTAPGGNGNGLWESDEEVDLVIQIYNMGVDTAKNTYGVISNTSPQVTILEDSCHSGNILSQDTIEMSFRVSAAGSAPNGYATEFDLSVVCNTGNWDYSLQVFINPLPSITFCEYEIVNGNGILEPGETADLIITLTNAGAAPAQNVSTTLISTSSQITIVDNSGNFGQIAIGDTISNVSDPFTVTAAATAPYGMLVACDLVVTAGLYVDTLPFALAIGEPVPSDTGYYYAYYSGGLHDYAPVFEWLALAPPGPGVIVSEITNEDADTVTVSLPFTFRYYGVDYSTVGICSNGFLELGSATHRFGSNTGIPAVGGPRAMVAPFWDDLDPSLAGDIYQYYDVVNHRWLVEFYDVAHYGATGDRETFQVAFLDPLYYPTPTGDGEVMVYYLTTLAQPGATFGLENVDETVGLEYYFDGVYHPWAAVVTDSFAVRYTTYPPDYLGVEEYGKTTGAVWQTTLSQVAPNPFSDQLQIRFSILDTGYSMKPPTLKIYNTAGRLVKSFDLGSSIKNQESAIIWRGLDDQGRRVPAGVYFIRLETDETRQVKKAVLLK